ncbi:LOW QUALITY PROTEIN: nephrin [Phaenicophaeus curvirostris]|uniref:LOW QUALITY PROTEIN: nephrin n=1 Tax=Phaenicophaeus curvirostris TaxID=33595 RepID=UPI0037F0DFBF
MPGVVVRKGLKGGGGGNTFKNYDSHNASRQAKWRRAVEARGVVLALLLLGVRGDFAEEPGNVSAPLGGGVTLRCASLGGGTAQWARGGLLLGALPAPPHPRYRPQGDPHKGEHHLRIEPVTLEDDATFVCQVGEGNGTRPRASRPAQLSVLVPPGPPRLELPPGPWGGGGEELTARCHVSDARPPATLTLSLGGELLPDVSTRVFEGSNPKLSSSEATVRLRVGPEADGQELVCAAANEAGAAPAPATATLRLLVAPSSPSIEGLESPQVRAGETLRLLCLVRGGNPPPSLHWDKDGTPLPVPWVGAGPQTSSLLVLLVGPGDDGVTLRCSVRSPRPPPSPSASVTLRVTYPPSEVRIAGTAAVAENGTVVLTCTSAPSNPPVRLRWWLGGRELEASDGGSAQAEGRGWVTWSNVTLRGRREEHGKSLECEAESPGGTRSAGLPVSVTRPPQALWLEPLPPGPPLRAGGRLRLRCLARGGHPPPRLAWTKDGRPVRDGRQASLAEGSLTSRELLVTLTPSDNGATYGCEATGDPRGDPPRAQTRLRVLWALTVAPVATVPPQSVAISLSPRVPRPGDTLVLTCLAGSSNPVPSLRWHRRGHPVAGEPLSPVPSAHSGVTAGSLLRLPVTLGDHGDLVTCEATSPGLGVTVSAQHTLLLRRASPRLRVGPGPALAIGNVSRGDAGTYGLSCRNPEGVNHTSLRLRVLYPPSIVWAPDPVVVDEGGAAELLCRVEGNPLPPNCLRWARLVEAQEVPVPVAGSLVPGVGGGAVALGRLGVAAAGRDVGGSYECRVDTGVPPPARAVLRLVVRYPPEVEAGPSAVLVAPGGDSGRLRCRARGVPPPLLTWELRGRPLAPQHGRFQFHQYAEGPWTSSTLTVSNLTLDRARLRHQFRYWDQYGSRPRHQYRNWNQLEEDWDWEENRNRSLGTFDCVAHNPLGTSRRRLQLRLADPPDPPQELRVSSVTPTSLSLSWTPGFDGGLPQSFLVSARGPGAPPPLVAPGPALTLGGLLPATAYDVTVRGRNARGDSAASGVRVVTSGEDRKCGGKGGKRGVGGGEGKETRRKGGGSGGLRTGSGGLRAEVAPEMTPRVEYWKEGGVGRPEVGAWKPEVGAWKPEVGLWKPEVDGEEGEVEGEMHKSGGGEGREEPEVTS